MNELLKINYEAEQPTVSARDLHEQLHIGTKFTTWFTTMLSGSQERKDIEYSKNPRWMPVMLQESVELML